MLPPSAPLRLRALRIEGRRRVQQKVDGYGIECRAVRDLLVEYFTERAPELDHVSLRSIARDSIRSGGIGRRVSRRSTTASVLASDSFAAFPADRPGRAGEGIRPGTARAFATRVRQEVGLASPADMIKSNGRKFYPNLALAVEE
ncbi:hypothetical protein [Streptomyces sp. ADI98-10]|uniref:hypothetical protein n=1 Tax=Streptomyces sp. ADI98-10 TaxID=1522763 RepID=UPI000F54F940|nr:hypothetical protein [Streptomyces sp. ADI98-10]RPK79658.1 hypothetical protein EES46_32015 [Streptomyces sp. ADI98-10]